jgi:Arc/MetJ-type ribon-helix-helix transcriptional regulator
LAPDPWLVFSQGAPIAPERQVRMPQPKVTLKIPRHLYDHIKGLIADSGFNSVTDFVVFVLRDIVYEGKDSHREFSAEELDRIKKKLKSLGYL